jgi:hypothetical protein
MGLRLGIEIGFENDGHISRADCQSTLPDRTKVRGENL